MTRRKVAEFLSETWQQDDDPRTQAQVYLVGVRLPYISTPHWQKVAVSTNGSAHHIFGCTELINSIIFGEGCQTFKMSRCEVSSPLSEIWCASCSAL